MIEAKNISKKFDGFTALDNISCVIPDGSIYGMVGTNGAGKSTLLRMLTGVYKPDNGDIMYDGRKVYENPEVKRDIAYVPDELYFLPGASMNRMAKLYAAAYPNFDMERFISLSDDFRLDRKKNISTFSKGMKRQAAIILALSGRPKYMFFDETFDGLDPVMRQAVKKGFIAAMEDRNMTPIIASHNLRELEDICDHVGLLHKGGILFAKDLDEMKLGIHRLQVVFTNDEERVRFEENQEIMRDEVRGSLHTYTIRSSMDDLRNAVASVDTIFSEILTLSLEEIFISETEVVGYDVKNIIE